MGTYFKVLYLNSSYRIGEEKKGLEYEQVFCVDKGEMSIPDDGHKMYKGKGKRKKIFFRKMSVVQCSLIRGYELGNCWKTILGPCSRASCIQKRNSNTSARDNMLIMGLKQG